MLAGRYELGAVLGQGGLGVVHEAHDTVLDRTVAIKSLHDRHADDPEQVQRLDEEARASASFSHPNAVILYDVVREDDRMHLVLEHVQGGPLPRVLRDGVLPESLAWVIGADVAGALGAAHARGLVHRDVKPSNVLVADDGICKLSDFGIARMVGRTANRLTQTGMVIGSPAYLAPEQVEDREVDGRADVYALGLLLGEAVSGSLGFGEGTQAELLTRRLARSPAPLSDRAEVTSEFDELITAMTARDPSHRPDAVVVAVALRGGVAEGARTALASRVTNASEVDDGAPTALVEAPDQSTVTIAPIVLPPTTVIEAPARDETQVLTDLPDGPAWAPPATGGVTALGDQVEEALTTAADGATAAGRTVRGVPPIMRWVLGGALALVLLVVAVDLLGTSDTAPSEAATGTPTDASIAVVAVADLDPFGDNQQEHPEDLPFLLDGDPATEWQTERYNSPTLDKPGVGVVFDLGEVQAVDEVVLTMKDAGATLELYVANEDPAGRPAPEVGTLVQTLEGVATSDVSFAANGTEARWWILWITRVGGNGRATVGGVTFR